jgi:hypothetical protein
MKNIQDLKRKYEKEFAKSYCDLGDISLCKKKFCYCSHSAEAWAYIDTVIPYGFRKLSMFDFTGKSKKFDELIPDNIVNEAKETLSLYCWGKTWKEITKQCCTDALVSVKKKKELIKPFLRNNSIMDDRLENGNSLVIHGSSDNKPIGRTMVAAIVMKEAIKLRMKNSSRIGQTYDWVDFTLLKQALIDDSIELGDYRSADWLVIDGIEANQNASPQSKAYFTSLLNPFFIDRFYRNLPTILVFKFDVRLSSLNIEDCLGSGISSIVYSDKTFNIPLSKHPGIK